MYTSIYNTLRVHVSESNINVIRKVRAKIAKKHRSAPAKRQDRKKLYKAILAEHKAARDLFNHFRF